MELISVVVPVYNVEKYLERCLNSLLNQTYKNIEIILVDDGSRDSSGSICDNYSKNYENIITIHKNNEGLGYARNTGLEKVKGKYVMFVDSDDYLECEMIENLYTDLIETNSDTCIGGFKRVYKDRNLVFKNKLAGNVYEGDEIKSKVLVRMTGKLPNGEDHIEMSVWKVLFSYDIIKKNKIKFPSERDFISEDIIFDMEYYSLCKKVCMSEDTGYCYCDNEDSLTTKYNSNRFQLQKKLYTTLVKKTKDLGIYHLCDQRLMTTLISNVRYCIKLEVKFKEINGKDKSIKNIREICNDEVLLDVLKEYDNKSVKFKSRIVNNLIKSKKYKIINSVMNFKLFFNR